MRFTSVIKVCFLIASMIAGSVVCAGKQYYPTPSSEPFEIGSEDFRSRHLTLQNLEGVFIDFTIVRSSSEQHGIEIPQTLYETVQQKIEAAGLLFLSEEEVMKTPGQPHMNLWPSYEGEPAATDVKEQSGSPIYPTCITKFWAGLEQSAMIIRQPENQFKLPTWGGGDETYQCERRGQWVADTIINQIDKFIADFKKAQIEPDPVVVANTTDVPQHCSQSWITHLNVFATNETKINNNIKPILDKLKDVAARCNTFSYIIETHADQRSNADYNRLLTEVRARSIKDYLISKGMEYHRIHMRPLGESAPIATGMSPEDHAKNRRVVIIPIKQEDIASAELEIE